MSATHELPGVETRPAGPGARAASRPGHRAGARPSYLRPPRAFLETVMRLERILQGAIEEAVGVEHQIENYVDDIAAGRPAKPPSSGIRQDASVDLRNRNLTVEQRG